MKWFFSMEKETRQSNQNQMKEEPNRHLVCFFHPAILLVDQTITSASHLTRLLQKHHCELLHLQAPRPPLSSLRLRQESSSACLQGDAQTLHSMRLLALLLLLLSRRGAPSAARHTSCCRAGCARLRCVEKQLECLPTQSEKRPPRPAVPAKSAASRRWRD